MDSLLSTREDEASNGVLTPLDPLVSTEQWFAALELPAESRMRRNPRFIRILQEFSEPAKYSRAQKSQMLHALKFGLSCDPERAGFEGGVVPYEVRGFNPDEMPGYRPPQAEA